MPLFDELPTFYPVWIPENGRESPLFCGCIPFRRLAGFVVFGIGRDLQDSGRSITPYAPLVPLFGRLCTLAFCLCANNATHSRPLPSPDSHLAALWRLSGCRGYPDCARIGLYPMIPPLQSCPIQGWRDNRRILARMADSFLARLFDRGGFSFFRPIRLPSIQYRRLIPSSKNHPLARTGTARGRGCGLVSSWRKVYHFWA